MRRSMLALCAAVLLSAPLAAEPPQVQWLRTYPGLGMSTGNWIRQTADGGFVAAGATGDTSPAPGYYYVVRLDSAGNSLWERTYSRATVGNQGAIAYAVTQTADGGFAVFGTDKGNDCLEQPHLVKLDDAGTVEWQRTYYMDTMEYGMAFEQAADGGYILAGLNGRSSTYLLKVDSMGTVQWRWVVCEGFRHTWPQFVPVTQAADSGYVTAGYSDTFGLTLWKLSATGTEVWRRTYSGEYANYGYGIARTSDGGFVITGKAGGPDRERANRICLLKVDSTGAKQWCRYFGERDWQGCWSVWQTSDGGFVTTGAVGSKNGVYREDGFVLRTDNQGNELWYTTLSPSTEDGGLSVQQTVDGGYVVCGGLGNGRESFLFVLKLAPVGIE